MCNLVKKKSYIVQAVCVCVCVCVWHTLIFENREQNSIHPISKPLIHTSDTSKDTEIFFINWPMI